MRVCRDLPAGFVGIGSEKSVNVAVCDTASKGAEGNGDEEVDIEA